MKCFACQTELEAGRARCPFCGFPVIQSVEGNPDEIEKIREMAGEYVRKCLTGIRIGIAAYSYAVDPVDQMLKPDQMHKIEAAAGEALAFGEIVWCQESFARVDPVDQLQKPAALTIYVDQENQEERVYERTIQIPKTTGFVHIGVKLEEGFCARMAYGNQEGFVLTEPFPLTQPMTAAQGASSTEADGYREPEGGA